MSNERQMFNEWITHLWEPKAWEDEAIAFVDSLTA